MNWKFSRQVWLYLASVVSFGLAMTFGSLLLNFYVKAQGLDSRWMGLLSATAAITVAVVSLPAVALAKRISNAHTLKLGAGLSVLGTLLIALSHGAWPMLVGAFVQGSGGALTMVAGAPFMANNSDEKTRVTLFSVQGALMTGAGFVGNLLAGRVPEWYAAITGADAGGLSALRAALLVSVGIQVLGLLPVLALRPTGKTSSEGRSFAVRDRKTMFRLIAPNMLTGLGAGATIPFINVFIKGKFKVDYDSLGTLFAFASLATAATMLIQPWVVKKLGQLRAVLAVQASSLPFLALLGFAPYLWMVSIALLMRGALMNAANPVYSSFAMTELPDEDRPMYSAVNTIVWNMAWALSSSLSGIVQHALPFESAFNVLFSWTLLTYIGSIAGIYIGLYLPAQRHKRAIGG